MFAKALLVGAFAALAVAQSDVLTFTRVPSPVTAGQTEAITYATNDTVTPVSIILRKGPSGDLQTVSTLTSSATGGQYIWTPAETLENGSDYALEIQQGTQINYFGPFSIQGGGQVVSSSTSASSSASASASIINSQNATSAMSTTSLIGTAPISAGTGGPSMSRNTTMSSATLTASSTSSHASTSSTGGATSTSPSSPVQTTNAASSIATGSSAIALIFGAVAAILYC